MGKIKKLNAFLEKEGVLKDFWDWFNPDDIKEWFDLPKEDLIWKSSIVNNENYWDRIDKKWLKHIEKKWKPKKGDSIYIATVDTKNKCIFSYWNIDDEHKNLLMNRGLIFKTKEEAIAMADKILNFIKDA